MAEDISRKTIVILTILVTFLSILGTWTVFHELDQFQQPTVQVPEPEPAVGMVRLNILGPDGQIPNNEVVSIGQGKVALTVNDE